MPKILIVFPERNDKTELLNLLLSHKGHEVKLQPFTAIDDNEISTFYPHLIIWQARTGSEAYDMLREFTIKESFVEKKRPANLFVVDVIDDTDHIYSECDWIDDLIYEVFAPDELWNRVDKLLDKSS